MEETPNGRVHLTGYLEVPAVRIADVVAALPAHIALTTAEPGCLSFNVTQSAENPSHFLVAETFANQAAFEAHQARAQASDWARVTQGLARHYTITSDPAL